MESLTPIKVEYPLPLGDLNNLFDTLENSIFETNQNLNEKGKCLLIDTKGFLFSCSVVNELGNEIVFKEDKQDRIFWIEDEDGDNSPKKFLKEELINFSGHLTFWSTFKSLRSSDVSVLYKAVIVNGILTKVDLVDSKIIPVQLKKREHKLEKHLLILASKIVHNVSVFLLQAIHNRIVRISS